MRLGTRIGQKTLEKVSKQHPHAKEHSESKGQFNTFGVPNGNLKGPNLPWLGFGLTSFK